MWLPAISGELQYPMPPGGGGGPAVDVGPTDWLDLLNGVAFISAGTRKGRFSITADFIYLGLKSEQDRIIAAIGETSTPVNASLNLRTETTFGGTSWTLAGGYQFRKTDRLTADGFVGVRYLGIDIGTTLGPFRWRHDAR